MNAKPHYKLTLAGELVLKFKYRIKFRNRIRGAAQKQLLMSAVCSPDSWFPMYDYAGRTH